MRVDIGQLGSARLFDAVIVGSGACGGWAAKELSEAGLDVLVVEAGGEVEPSVLQARPGTGHDSPASGRTPSRFSEFFARNPALNPSLFVDSESAGYTTPSGKPFEWMRVRHLGGRTLTWGRVALRFSPHELTGPYRDGYGDQWPFSYDELAPHYEKVETFLGVCGARDGLAQLPDGRFLPPCSMTPGERHLKALVQSRWPDRHVINCRGMRMDSEHLEGGNSPSWPRWTTPGSTLLAAFRTKRTLLATDAVVSHLEADRGGANKVIVIDRKTGKDHEISGKVVVLCASTIESTRILLNSVSTAHPAGIGGSSGVLGCYLMDHVHTSIFGVIPDLPALDEPPRLDGPEAISIPRFQNLERHSERFAGGYGVWGGVQRRIPGWPGGGKAPSPILMYAHGETVARRENRLTLDRNAKDSLGIPTVHIDYSWTNNDARMVEHMSQCLLETVELIGGKPLRRHMPNLPVPGSLVHEVGTARMGADPRTSVLDPYNRCWDAKGVYVTDGACWVSSGWQNPTLTMMAITVRACAHILRQFKSGIA